MCGPTMTLKAPRPVSDNFNILRAVSTQSNLPISQRKRTRVRFSPSVATCEAKHSETENDTNALWYNRQALAAFKTEAKQQFMVHQLYRIHGGQDSLRGLENCTVQRQYWRHRTIQATLSAHKKGMNGLDIAAVSRKCTTWNEEIAFVQACHDYCEVYQPEMILPQVPVNPPRFPFELKRANHQESQRRRVRRRTS